jgi:hypothetical protein
MRTKCVIKNKWEDNLEFWFEEWNWKKNQINKRIQKKIKIKWIRTKFEKITNHNYGSNNEIENKLKFDKRTKNEKKKD